MPTHPQHDCLPIFIYTLHSNDSLPKPRLNFNLITFADVPRLHGNRPQRPELSSNVYHNHENGSLITVWREIDGACAEPTDS